MLLNIKTLGGNFCKIEVNPTDSILDIKRKIYKLKYIKIESQKILHKKIELYNDELILNHKIYNNEILLLFITNRIIYL